MVFHFLEKKTFPMEVRRLTADCSEGHRWCYSYVNPFEIPLKLWKNEDKLRNALKKIERARSDFMRNRISFLEFHCKHLMLVIYFKPVHAIAIGINISANQMYA